MVSPYQWVLPDPLSESIAARFRHTCRPLLQVFYSRHLVDTGEGSGDRLRDFFSISGPEPDPLRMLDMDRAVDRILHEIARSRPIGVFGHYDCDGVTATVLLCQALSSLGASVVPHIPSRNDDYGIPLNGIQRLAQAGVSLVVTVDCGIKAMEEVRAAALMGIDIVITDHHQCERYRNGKEPGQHIYLAADGDILPRAAAVVNPRRASCTYPFKSLAGVGIAFRLAQALAKASPGSGLSPEVMEDLLDLVCIGTVADIVDLVGENRRLVAQGLQKMKEFKRPGLRCLAGAAGLVREHLTARDIGFMLAPRINAAARLEHGKLSLNLLLAPSCSAAEPIALRLEELNLRRRQLTEVALQRACEVLGERTETQSVLVAAGDWLSGLSGLVASQLKERFGRPALAICDPGTGCPGEALSGRLSEEEVETGDALCVGSARSIPGFDITRALGQAHERLLRYGGHCGAAGFTVRRSEIPALEKDLNEYTTSQIAPEMLEPRLIIEGVLTPSDLSPALRSQIHRMEPFGQGNPSPLFLLKGATALPSSAKCYPNNKFSLRLHSPAGLVKASGQAELLTLGVGSGRPMDLVCYLAADFQAAGRLRVSILDARPSGEEAICGPSPRVTAELQKVG